MNQSLQLKSRESLCMKIRSYTLRQIDFSTARQVVLGKVHNLDSIAHNSPQLAVRREPPGNTRSRSRILDKDGNLALITPDDVVISAITTRERPPEIQL
jgi:hypothetical protein